MSLLRAILGLKPIYPTAWSKFMGLLLKTGQTTQYSGKEDDGYFEKGLSKDYTVLSIGQYSGTVAIVLNGKTHNLSNNCVMDNRTGLMWARYVPDADIGPGADGKLYWLEWQLANKTDISFTAATKKINSVAGEFSTGALAVGRVFTVTGSNSNDGTYTVVAITASDITTSEALVDEATGASVTIDTVSDRIWDFKDQANTKQLGGHADWRVPNISELWSLFKTVSSAPFIDQSAFPSTLSDSHWTSSTYPPNSLRAFIRDFGSAFIGGVDKTTNRRYCRLVRLG